MTTVTSHEINLYGLSGSIFWTTLIGFIFFVLGFATATQAMITIGLILFVGATLAIFIYMFLHELSFSKSLLIKVFCGLSFATVLFTLIGVAIYGGTEKYNLNWSYAFTIIGGIFSLISASLSLFHMKKSSIF
ncbi:hypothetical protein HELRODRAFT_176072 [Helobdella robusta]|uniref:MARVEL domain-containing protein n=1 Tax=Helobdella robusta TaxID=6412 RepID=T1FA40_HELRO|nr:hypothetical protein HELRODRAFT_176072 [Helobdella robusta]ESO00229.1 hypothetical protein HELRODRAFT_176072 [Helobdella robusta]